MKGNIADMSPLPPPGRIERLRAWGRRHRCEWLVELLVLVLFLLIAEAPGLVIGLLIGSVLGLWLW